MDILKFVFLFVIYFDTIKCTVPTISPLKTNSDCQDCIIGEDKERIKITCDVDDNSIVPNNVVMKINDEILQQINDENHVVFLTLNSYEHHLAQLECIAVYNTTNITAHASIYLIIIKHKAPSVILPSELIEGDPNNISCLVEGRRPAADNITMWIDDHLVETTVTIQKSTIIDTLYNSWVTVTDIKRVWNKKNVTCCEYNKEFLTDYFIWCSKNDKNVINYIFPPSNVKLTLDKEHNITENRPFTNITATCVIEDSNPLCIATWNTSDIEILRSGLKESIHNETTMSKTSTNTAYMNVSAADNKKVITCSSNCTTKFSKMPSSSVIINLLDHEVPTISPLKTNSDCQDCIIGEDKQGINITCDVDDDSIVPNNVVMKINDEILQQINDEYHVVFLTLNSTEHHLAQLECISVYNTTNFTAQASIYVIIIEHEAPSVILPFELIEGDQKNISCLVEGRRPAANNITMWIDDLLVESEVTIQKSPITDTLYNSWVTVTDIKRAWNKKNVICCEYNKDFTTDNYTWCSNDTNNVINYIFPPSNVELRLEKDHNITENRPFTIIIATCVIEDFNPLCIATWNTSDIEILTSGLKESIHNETTMSKTSIFTAYMNVSAADNKKVITCSPNCTTKFSKMPSSSVIIYLLDHEDDVSTVGDTGFTTKETNTAEPSNNTSPSGNVDVSLTEKKTGFDKYLIYIILGSGGGLMILSTIVVVTVCIYRSKKKDNPVDKTKGSANDTNTNNANSAYDMTVYEECGQEPTQEDEHKQPHGLENEYSVAQHENTVNAPSSEDGDIYNHVNQDCAKPIQDDNYSHLPMMHQNQSSAIVDETYSHLANQNPIQCKGAYITESTYSNVQVGYKSHEQQAANYGQDSNYDGLNCMGNKETIGKLKPDICVQDNDYDHV